LQKSLLPPPCWWRVPPAEFSKPLPNVAWWRVIRVMRAGLWSPERVTGWAPEALGLGPRGACSLGRPTGASAFGVTGRMRSNRSGSVRR
jgi:hypothetical protein